MATAPRMAALTPTAERPLTQLRSWDPRPGGTRRRRPGRAPPPGSHWCERARPGPPGCDATCSSRGSGAKDTSEKTRVFPPQHPLLGAPTPAGTSAAVHAGGCSPKLLLLSHWPGCDHVTKAPSRGAEEFSPLLGSQRGGRRGGTCGGGGAVGGGAVGGGAEPSGSTPAEAQGRLRPLLPVTEHRATNS